MKQQIIGSFYPEKIIFENYKPRTTRLNSVLSLICTSVGGSSFSKNRKIRKNADLSVKAPPIEYTSNELLEDLQRIYRLKAIINDYGNKAVRDIQNLQKKMPKRGNFKKEWLAGKY